jgi:WD40 repeat protein
MTGYAGTVVACSIAALVAWASSSPGYGRVYSTQRSVVVMKGELQTVKLLAFSADGQRIASGDGNGGVEVWDVRPAQRLRTIKGSSKIFAMAFSPDGRQLAASGDDGKINVWPLQGDEAPLSFEVPGGPVYSIGYLPDGNRIAAGCRDGMIRLYSTTGQLLRAFGDIVSGISIVDSPAGARIAALEGQGLRIWDAETGELVLTRKLDMVPWFFPHMHHIGLTQNPIVRLSPGADFVAVAGDPAPGSSPPGIYFLIVWDTRTGKKAIELGGIGSPLYSFSARRTRIAESSFAGMSAIDIETRKELHRYDVNRDIVRSLVLSPDARWIASGHDDGSVRIWNAQ